MLDTYVIAVAATASLVLVDQHAAHERLTHEALRAQMLAGGVRSQPLLLPAVVDLPPADARAAAGAGGRAGAAGAGDRGVRPRRRAGARAAGGAGAPEPAPLLRDLADELAEPTRRRRWRRGWMR